MHDKELPKRKPNRLQDYDYSMNGAYFLTLCVRNRESILSRISAEAGCMESPAPELSEIGRIVESAILAIPEHYPDVTVDKYVIMPNHVHIILLTGCSGGRAMLAPTGVSKVVQQMKGYITKQCGTVFRQKSYFDHIIRNAADYLDIWNYIDSNPARWHEEAFFRKTDSP